MGGGQVVAMHARMREGSQDGRRLDRQLLKARYDRFEPSLQAGAREARVLGMKEASPGYLGSGSGEGEAADVQGGADQRLGSEEGERTAATWRNAPR